MAGSCPARKGWAWLLRAICAEAATLSSSIDPGLSHAAGRQTDSLLACSLLGTKGSVHCVCNAVLLQLACGKTARHAPQSISGFNHHALPPEQNTLQQRIAVPHHPQCEGPYKHFCQHHQSIRLQQYYCHQSGPHWQSTYPQQHHQQGRLQHLPKPMNLGSQHKLLCSAATVAVPRQPHSQGPHWRCFHTEQQHQRSQDRQRQQADNAGTQATVGQQQQQRQQRAPGASWTSLPNLLSLSRVVSGPWVAWLIATQQWPLAVGLTALAGVTDWLDGHLARQMGHTSKLGSYLDPLADKILIGSVVGTMGYLGMLPGWLAVVVVGRDAAQVTGMMWYRVKMFGGAWPGAAAFFDVDGTTPAATTATAQTAGSASATTASSTGSQASSKAAAGVGLPQMKPLMVSKLNTVLIFVLVAGCISQEWQGVPGQEVLDILEYSIAGTTAASAVAYVGLYRAGKLLPAAATPVAGPQ